MPRVLIVGDHADQYRQLLEPMDLPDWHASYLASAADALDSMADVEILFGPPDELVQPVAALSGRCSGPSPVGRAWPRWWRRLAGITG